MFLSAVFLASGSRWSGGRPSTTSIGRTGVAPYLSAAGARDDRRRFRRGPCSRESWAICGCARGSWMVSTVHSTRSSATRSSRWTRRLRRPLTSASGAAGRSLPALTSSTFWSAWADECRHSRFQARLNAKEAKLPGVWSGSAGLADDNSCWSSHWVSNTGRSG